jgi:hypothetical protein
VLNLLRTNLAVRLSLLLVSLMLAGAVIGYAWEAVVYPSESSLEKVEARADELLPPSSFSRSPDEEAILARALEHFPPYPGASSRPEVLAADYLGTGAPIAVAWFSTKDAPQKVLSHYRGMLADAGLPPLSADLGKNGGYVGYWSPASKEVRLVSVLAQGDETLVFVSAGQVEKVLQGGASVPDWIPLPPDAEDPRLLSFKMEGATNYVISGKVEGATVAEVEAGWRKALEARGWHTGEATESGFLTRGFEVSHDEGAVGQVMLRQATAASGVEFNLSVMQRMLASQ